MHLAVEHRTHYSYDGKVRDSINEACLCPCSNDLQLCHSFDLEIMPSGANVLKRIDFYTNQVHHFEIHEAHDSLDVRARSVVETFVDSRDFEVASPTTPLGALKWDSAYYDFLSDSERVQVVPMIQHEAREIVGPFEDVQAAAGRIMSFIFREFKYTKGVTGVETAVTQVFSRREGVCQDFAHVMIALCRAMGIPARYVSGYFYSEHPGYDGADDNTASHAWVECFLPEIGWVGYDPTHDRRADDRYIKVAIGRDYTDVRPVSGTFHGKQRATMEVAVSVKRLAD